MIVIKAELHSARNGKISELGRMHICNDGKRTREDHKRGTYNVTLFRKRSDKVLRSGVIEDWPRFSYSIWKMIIAAIDSVYPNPKSKLNEILENCGEEINLSDVKLTKEDYAIMTSEEYD